jgi:hypothetical protein
MLAYGLHKLLGLEAKLGKIEIKSDGILARWWRDRLKRLESQLGIGSRGADAQAISRRNAQDKLIALATLGKPWWAVGTFGTRRYEKALMRAGDASFHGLDDTLDELGTEMRITTRIDRMGAFKNLPNRTEDYTLRSLRPSIAPQGAPGAAPDDISALTSEGAPGRTTGPDTGAPGATPGEAQANRGPQGRHRPIAGSPSTCTSTSAAPARPPRRTPSRRPGATPDTDSRPTTSAPSTRTSTPRSPATTRNPRTPTDRHKKEDPRWTSTPCSRRTGCATSPPSNATRS